MGKTTLCFLLIFLFCISTFPQTEINPCPSITIYPPDSPTKPNEEVIFAVSLRGYEENHDVKYIWTISDGEIIEGQNTPVIKVKQKIDYIRATVEITGVLEDCGNMASASTVPYNPPIAFVFDEHKFFTNRTNMEDFYYPDSFGVLGELQLRSGATVFVVQHFKRNTPAKIIKQRTERTFKNLKEYIDAKQITIANKKGVKNLIQIWIVPKDSDYPMCKNCEIIKGVDIERKKLRNLRNKKLKNKQIKFIS